MRLKQTLFWLLAVILTFGVGALGYLWGARINSYAAKLPQEKLTAAERTSLSAKTFDTNFVEDEVWRGFFENPINCDAPDARAKTLVVPHHLITGNYLAGIFNSLKNTHPRVVVIVGPNHAQAGDKTILTTDANWQTVFGNLSGNQDLVGQLVTSGLVGIDNEIFNNEQSISSLIPFVKNTWPETQVVPLVIKNEKNEEMMEGLANKLREILPSDSLVIASVDFSHYLPKDVANFHDDLAINVLSTNDLNRIRKMEIDSQNSIRVLFNYNKIIGANKFNLINHTNSADILHQDDLVETTSHVMGYYTAADSSAVPEF